MGEEKSVDLLIESQEYFIKLKKNCKLLLVGDGPDIEKYKKMAKKLKCASANSRCYYQHNNQ